MRPTGRGLKDPDLHHPGFTTQMRVDQMPVGGATDCGPEHYTDTQGRASLNVWAAKCQGNLQKQYSREHRHSPGWKLKLSFPRGIEPGPSGWKARP